jgi:hypothetical protein
VTDGNEIGCSLSGGSCVPRRHRSWKLRFQDVHAGPAAVRPESVSRFALAKELHNDTGARRAFAGDLFVTTSARC